MKTNATFMLSGIISGMFFSSSLLAATPTISAGSFHVIALKADGTVWAWGDNAFGQLGNNSTTDSSTAVQVLGLSDVKEISAGTNFNIAVKNDGSVYAWGMSPSGEIGSPTADQCPNASNVLYPCAKQPVKIQALTSIKKIKAGSPSLAIGDDGSLWGWGDNSSKVLGSNTSDTSPRKIGGIENVTEAESKLGAAIALTSNGDTWIWGGNRSGVLRITGLIDVGSTHIPTKVPNLTGVISVAASGNALHVLKSDGNVYSWGGNMNGELGSGSPNSQSDTLNKAYGLSNVVKISAGSSHVMALKDDGTAWGWGSNYSGALGNSSYNGFSSAIPLKSSASDISNIYPANGWGYTLALDRNNNIINIGGAIPNGTNVSGIISSSTTTTPPTTTTSTAARYQIYDCLFYQLENTFPSILPGRPTRQTSNDIYYKYYSGTATYLGVLFTTNTSSLGSLLIMSPLTGNQITTIGSVSEFLTQFTTNCQ